VNTPGGVCKQTDTTTGDWTMPLGAAGPFAWGMLSQGELLDNRYRIGSLLGQGGMAVVYRATDETLDREVAVKVLRSQYASDPDFARRFGQEARNAASLAHPSIAQVFDTGVHDDLQYIVMQLVDGPDLEAVLAERGRLPLGDALRIVTEAAEALQAAHDRGIVHRDIKPGNILLTSDGEVRIVDFGIAHALGDSRTTNPGLLLGSLPYCSPEQILGEPVGPASDIYSLGVVFHELVTGRRLFDGTAPAAVALQRLRDDPPAPSDVAAGIPDRLDEIVLRALRRDPRARYRSAKGMADAIRKWWQTERRQRERHRPSGAPPEGRPPFPAIPQAMSAATTPALELGPTIRTPRVVVSTGRAPLARPYPEERRRRRSLALLLIPLAAFLFVGAAFWTLTGRLQNANGGVLGVTSSPGQSAIAVLPSTSTTPTPSVGATPSPLPLASPSPTREPTRAPTPSPSPRITAPPTAPAVAVSPRAGSPAAVVARFYEAVEAHDFDAAASLWTPRMRREYPPDGYIDGRFSHTTRIDLRRNKVVALDTGAGTAVVSVDLIEYRDIEPSPRRFVGRWELVLTDQGWLMDKPHF
jgi:eukaryotic-like serine/threonine-protein kinase